MRSVTALFATLALALALTPAAMALGSGPAVTAAAPSSLEVGVPDEEVTVQGQSVRLNSKDQAPAPVEVVGSARLDDVDLGLKGPRCKLDLDTGTTDSAADSCDTGGVETNAGLGVIEARVGVRFGDIERAASSNDAATAAATALGVGEVPATTVLLVAAAAGASLGAIYGVWRAIKWIGLAAFLPLYSHISDDEVLNDPNRAAIHRLIRAEPGIATKDIADRLNLAWGTVTHHLSKLEKRRFVVSRRYGKYRRYFVNGAADAERKDEIATLRLDRTGDIAGLIQERPGVTQKEVSTLLGVSSSTILWHVKRLEKVNLVTKIRDGKQVRYYPGEALGEATLVGPSPMANAA